MTQHTMDPGATPESQQTEETGAAKSGARPRRRGTGRGRAAPKAATQETQTTTPEVQIAVPTEPAQAQAATIAAQPEAQPEAPNEAATPRRASSRARRGRSSAARHETPVAEPAAETPAADALAATLAETPAAQPQPTLGELTAPVSHANANGTATTEALPRPVTHAHEPLRTVPALTPEAWPAPQPEQAQPAAEAPAEPTPAEPAPTSRYRFRKPSKPIAQQQTPVRPERIGGQAQTPVEEQAPTPESAFEPPMPAPAHPGHQVSPGLGDLLERLGQRESPPAFAPQPFAPQPFAPQPFAPSAPEELTREASAAELSEPLEHEEEHPSDTESSSGRRRRRRRGRHSTSTEGELLPTDTEERVALPDAAETRGRHGATSTTRYAAPAPAVPDPYAGAGNTREAENGYYDDYAPDEEELYAPAPPYPAREPDQAWDIASAQRQMRESRSPFTSPDPAMARGFGPQPSGVAGPAREMMPRQGRTSRGDRDVDVPPMSANQLGSVITQAIQRQTDRLLTELRHQQNPPSMTVMMPNYPSTERVGVFVDVANLHYSARSLRMALDFGQLLEFLRGNRRLIRAHAYAPTNPDPNADQAFLSAVKGLGYRITTKNFKTFASGAKKADMDLDLCMDIVRMVDAGALDTVVLVSGDSDFLPLLEYCSDHGVRVEVAAFDDSAAAILRQSCDLFINLSMVDDIRG